MENNIMKKAITYSLLAHIKNSGLLSEGPLDIFIPVVKKGLYYMNINKQQYKGANISEISNIIEDLYGIDIPFPVLKNILKKIAKEINTKAETVFVLNHDDSFWIKDFIFEDYNDEIERSKRDIKNIQDLFKDFCKINNFNCDENNCIIKFIEKNKASISSYLANNKRTNGNDYTIAALFVDYFKKIPYVYSQIKDLYLGSILTCYLDYEPSNVKMGITLLFDTNFIVSLLDLNTPESTHTCQKLLEICKRLGYKFQVLKDTIEEIKGLLNFKSLNYDKAIIVKYINREDIYNACERRKLTPVDLDRISDNLESTLLSYEIITIPHTDNLRNKAKFTKEYKLLKPYRNSEKAALHDAMAIIYVKETRGKNVKNFEKANCWFVNNSISHDSDKESIDALLNNTQDQFQPEVIKADDLLNILWLSNPNINTELANNELIDIGLTSLVAFSLNDSLPKARVIKELDENIQKYKNTDFDDKDVLLLSTRIVKRQIQDIEALNELAQKDSVTFAERIKDEAKKQETIENERAAKIEDLIKKLSLKIKNLEVDKGVISKRISGQREDEIVALNNRIYEQDKEIMQLQNEKIGNNNKIKKEKKEQFIKEQLLRWRRKTWLWLIVFIVILIACIIWLDFICNGDASEINNKLDKIYQNKIIAVLFSIISMIVNTFIIKLLYDKYNNNSNIENYKKSIKIPEDLEQLEESVK